MSEFINPDIEREKRCGVPEIVFGSEKSAEELIEISKEFINKQGRVIITRIDNEKVKKLGLSLRDKNFIFNHNGKGRILAIKKRNFRTKRIGMVGIITAGTSDIPVAEEAKGILEELGCDTVTEYDVGIAGIHRVFSALKKMSDVKIIIVIAGMEGALPSVVSGLTDKIVIAVPTSIGYGTGGGGFAALNTMLNSCTPLAVVNIDNGYGAAVFAFKILKIMNQNG